MSEVRIVSAECRTAVSEQNVGIGQLFKHFKLTPNFNLLRAGRYSVGGVGGSVGCAENVRGSKLDYDLCDNYSDTVSDLSTSTGGYSLWREYDLFDSEHVHCRITERYKPDFLNMCVPS